MKVTFNSIFILFLFTSNTHCQDYSNFRLQEKLTREHETRLNNFQLVIDTTNSSTKRAYIFNKISMLYSQANYYLVKPKNDSIEYYAKKAINEVKDSNTKEANLERFTAYTQLGFSFKGMGNYHKAINYFYKVIHSTECITLPSYYYRVREESVTGLCYILKEEGKLSEALAAYRNLLKYVEQNKIDEGKVSSIVYLLLSRISKELDQYDTAISYAQKAIARAISKDLPHRIGMGFLELSAIKMKQKKYNEVEFYLSKAYENIKNTKYTTLLSKYYFLKAKLYDVYSQKKEKLLFAEKGLNLQIKDEPINNQISNYQLLAECYEENGNYEKANRHLKEIINIKELQKKRFLINSLQNKSILKTSENLKAPLNTKYQLSRLNLIIILLMIFILSIGVFYTYNNRNKKIKLANTYINKNPKTNNKKEKPLKVIDEGLKAPLTSIKDFFIKRKNNSKTNYDILNNKNTSSNKKTILIIEDNENQKITLLKEIEKLYKTIIVSNGIEAFRTMENSKIDLIISETTNNSLEFLNRLKGSNLYNSTPLIVITSSITNFTKSRNFVMGIDDYIKKPFSSKELIIIAEYLLRNRFNRERFYLESDEKLLHNSKNCFTEISHSELEWIHSLQKRLLIELENDKYKLTSLATELNLSIRQLQRKTKKITGLSPKQLQKEIALQKAKNLLEHRKYDNISAVAYSIGINNVTRFSEQYEERFGKKPKNYF